MSDIDKLLVAFAGRFRLATSVVFFSRWLITTPVALIAIFVFFLDLNSVNGALVVGYATASCVLTFIVLRSDFERLSRLMQEMNNPVQGGLEYLEDFDDELSDDDDDDDDESSSDDSSAQDLEKPPKGLRHRVPQESL